MGVVPEVAGNPLLDERIVDRAVKIVSLEIDTGVQEEEAIALTDTENFGALVYLVAIAAFSNSKLQLKTGLPQHKQYLMNKNKQKC